MSKPAVERLGLSSGTHPENLAAIQLHRWEVPFVQQHRVGRYRLDFAMLAPRIAIEIDGPHHQMPDMAARDAARDARLRAEGWIVLRVTAGDTEQLLRAVQITRAAPDVDVDNAQ